MYILIEQLKSQPKCHEIIVRCLWYFMKSLIRCLLSCVFFRMSLSKTFRTATKPYERLPQIKVKVLAVKDTTKVQRWEFDGEGAKATQVYQNRTAAVTDGQTVQKCVLFEDLLQQINEGQTYIVRNYGMSKCGHTKSMLSRKNTAIYTCAPLQAIWRRKARPS